MYEEDLASNIVQWLIFHKIQPNQTTFALAKYKKGIFSVSVVKKLPEKVQENNLKQYNPRRDLLMFQIHTRLKIMGRHQVD